MKEQGIKNAPYSGKDPFIFVSYTHDDTVALEDINRLNRLGYHIWHDREIRGTEQFEAVIGERIGQCAVYLIFVSTKSLDADWVRWEFKRAARVNANILPIFLEKDLQPRKGIISIEGVLEKNGINRYNYTNDPDEYFVKLIEMLPIGTRKSPYERDSKNLGLGYLPSKDDINCGKDSLTEEEKKAAKEDARNRIVLAMTDNDPRCYDIENVFQLTSEETKAKERLGTADCPGTDPLSPCNVLEYPLHIDTAYVAPLRLVKGLITRLDSNWPPLVNSYSRLVKKEANTLDDFHYFIEYCWLAWGPSVQTASLLESKSEFMILQAAFGDEANSLPLIVKRDRWQQIEKSLGKGRHSGWPVCLRNLLIVRPGADDFFKETRDYPLFKDMFAELDAVALYLPFNDIRSKKPDDSPEENQEGTYADGEINLRVSEQDAFYSTAYVWLILEQLSKEEVGSQQFKPGNFLPGRVVPFFEHANLATSKGLNFLQHCLARKALYHVIECERDDYPDYKELGYYRFSTALFPEEMAEILKAEIALLAPDHQGIVADRFVIPERGMWRTSKDVLDFADALDEEIRDALGD
jgi:hypothetical protein